MSHQKQERLDLIDKFKRLEPFYQQYMKEDSAFRNYQNNLANREHNRQIINNLQQYIENENLEQKAKLVKSIRGNGWKRSKYVLFRSIVLFFIFYSFWGFWGHELLSCLPQDFVYTEIINYRNENYTSSTLYLKESVSFYGFIIWVFVSMLLSIYLPISYYNSHNLGKGISSNKNIKGFIILFILLSVVISLGYIYKYNFSLDTLLYYPLGYLQWMILNPYLIAAVVVQVIYLSYLAKKVESNSYYSNKEYDGSLGGSIEKDYHSSIYRLQEAQKWFNIYDDYCKKYEERNGTSIYENILNHPMYKEIKDSIPEYYLHHSAYGDTIKASSSWLSEILFILQTGRADTLKEAINVKISDDNRDEMLGKIKAAESAASSAERRAVQAELDAARARNEARNAQNAADAANRRASDAEWKANQSYYRH
jgi:hypothetical protein